MTDTGITNIRGKEYHTVALRVSKFRDACPNYALTTSVVVRDQECVVMQAQIADETGRIVATGHAEEYRTSSQINRTSALENCETSAIGRALAAFGFGGTEFASANEVQNAIHQQDSKGADAGQSSSTVSQRPPANDSATIDQTQFGVLQALIETTGADIQGICKAYKVEALKELAAADFPRLRAQLERKLEKKNGTTN
jgi:hypothetical protein